MSAAQSVSSPKSVSSRSADLDQSYLLPQVILSQVTPGKTSTSYVWNTKKLLRLRCDLPKGDVRVLRLDKISKFLTVEKVVDLFQAMNSDCLEANQKLDEAHGAVSFDLTSCFVRKEDFIQFQKLAERQLGYVPKVVSPSAQKLLLTCPYKKEKSVSDKSEIENVDEYALREIKQLYSHFDKPEMFQLSPELDEVRGKVEKLDFSHFQMITPFLLRCLSQAFPQLKELRVDGSYLRYEHIEALTFFSQLQSLSLKECTVKDEDLTLLSRCNKLQELNLDKTQIKGTFFNVLPSSIRRLSCDWCIELQDSALSHLQNKMHLQMLIVSNTNITGKHFEVLPPYLQILNCRFCYHLNDVSIYALRNKQSLHVLDISWTSVKGYFLKDLPRSIQVLLLGACHNIDDDVLFQLREKTELRKLDISYTEIRGNHFKSLPESLQEFNCSKCLTLTPENIAALFIRKNLQSLDVSFTLKDILELQFPPALTVIGKPKEGASALLTKATKAFATLSLTQVKS